MKKAFTLIELLIVIAIIGILAAILFVSIGQSPLQGSRDAKRVSDMQAFGTALSLYYADNNRYPTADTEVAASGVCVAGGACPLVPKYSNALPRDPLHDDTVTLCTALAAAWNTTTLNSGVRATMPALTGGAARFAYIYRTVAGGQAYLLQACLENVNYKTLASDCDDVNASIPACTAKTGANAANEVIYEVHS